jgi:hypothetical protein
MLSLTACKTVSTPVRPPSVDSMRECLPLPDVRHGMTMDDLLRWAGVSIEIHNRCIVDHHNLREYQRSRK